MTQTNRRRIRWTAPVGAAALVAVVAVAPHALAGDPHPALAHKTASQLVSAIADSKVDTISGKVHSTPALGLPSLPDNIGGSQLTSLLTQPADWTVATSGPTRQRLALLGTGKEMDLIHNGSTVWTWDSTTQHVNRYTLPSPERGADAPSTDAMPSADPAQTARSIVKQIDPTTKITVGPTTRVAGRDAYTLSISPRQSGSLVGRIDMVVDAQNYVPLGISIVPTGSSEPALSERFTSVSFDRPSNSVFDFTPPRGASVTVHKAVAGEQHTGHPDLPGAKTVGTGWAAVAEFQDGGSTFSAPTSPSYGSRSGTDVSGLLQRVTTAGPDGSRILSTRLLTAMITSDGRVLVGAVPAKRLEAVAAQH